MAKRKGRKKRTTSGVKKKKQKIKASYRIGRTHLPSGRRREIRTAFRVATQGEGKPPHDSDESTP